MGLAGKRFVVTGVASGIGAALADGLTAQGAMVIGLDVAPGTHVSHLIDLSDPASVEETAKKIDGPLNGVANVAGLPGTHPVSRVLAVNLLGLRALTDALSPKVQTGGSIVNVSSVTADRCTWTEAEIGALLAMDWTGAQSYAETAIESGKDAYELSKKALNQWMLSACAALAPRRVRVNCVSPGPVETPILGDFEASIGEDRIAAAASLTGRHARPGDIADVVAFLLSDAARWINGVVLKADGGLHGLRAARAFEEAD